MAKQLDLKQGRARRLGSQQAEHTRRQAAASAETGAKEGGRASALEEGETVKATWKADNEEARSVARHKAKREGSMTLWEKAEKDAARKTAKQLQARIRQLASETAAIFDFDVGQSAEVADGKSRYRLNRVFSTKELESPEETVKRYWRRAAEQPKVAEFIKGEAK